jgi:hypothetical protein
MNMAERRFSPPWSIVMGRKTQQIYTALFEQQFKCKLTHSKNLKSEEGAPSCT